jgi:hypothetical protein
MKKQEHVLLVVLAASALVLGSCEKGFKDYTTHPPPSRVHIESATTRGKVPELSRLLK